MQRSTGEGSTPRWSRRLGRTLAAAAVAALVAVGASGCVPVIGGVSWIPIFAPGPSGRWGHTAAIDQAHDRMLVFGGSNDGAFLNDVWAFSLSARTWSKLTTTGGGPSPRLTATMMVDAPRDRLLLFGGFTGTASGETWSLDLTTAHWTLLPWNGPSARYDAALAFDSTRAWLYGGFAADGSALADLWEVDLATGAWRLMPTPTGAPPARTNTTFGKIDGDLVTTGGHPETGINTDSWRYDLATERWQQLTETETPLVRSHAAATVDTWCNSIWQFGGDNNDEADGAELLAVDQQGDELRVGSLAPTGWAPQPRRHSVVVYDAARREVILMGGRQGATGVLGDTWVAPVPSCPTFA